MKKIILALIAVGSFSSCSLLDVQRDPVTGLVSVVDATTGETVVVAGSPVDAAETDPTGLAAAGGALIGAVTANPGAGAGATMAISWILSLFARRKADPVVTPVA